MEFVILGPLAVVVDGAQAPLEGGRQRALLARLLIDAGRVVSVDRLVEDLWGGRPPRTAVTALQGHVSRLRRALGAGVLVTEPPGYAIRLSTLDGLDAARFEALAAEGRQVLRGGDAASAARILREALALFRGPALGEFIYEDWARDEAQRLEELRVATLEERIEADLRVGGHAELVGELERLAREHPLRERFHAQLMLALYRAGRQAEALAHYRVARRALVDEVGIEPMAMLAGLERRILSRDPALEPPPPTPQLGPKPTPPPVALTPLLGRAAEARELTELLLRERARLVTLTGPGGVGKTRLAMEVAAAAGEAGELQVGWADLAGVRDAQLVEAMLARAVGLHDAGDQDLRPRLVARLSEPVLVVLDNFEQLLDAAPVVAELLAHCPRLQVLVTSRVVLRVFGEQEYPLRPLPVRDGAVALFAARLRAVRRDFVLSDDNASLIAEICRRLDGLPLSIELAAARAKVMPLRAVRDRLADPLWLLDAPGERAPRQRSLRSVLDWSYELLDEPDRRVFRALGVLAGSFSLEACEALCAGEEIDVLAAIERLVDSSLVTVAGDDGRFGVLEMIREYAGDRLRAAGEADDVARRHAVHFADWAAAVEPELVGADQLCWLDRLEAELPNLRAALEHAVARGASEPALRLVASLWRFWEIRGYVGEGREWAERALALVDGADSRLRGAAYRAAGNLARDQGDYVRATACHRQARRMAREAGAPRDEAIADANLGAIAIDQGRFEDAELLFGGALDGFRELGDRSLEALMLNNLGFARLGRGRLTEAEVAFRASAARFDRLGDALGEARALHGLGEVVRALGRRDEAVALLRRSLEPRAALGDRRGVAECLEAFAQIRADEGRAAAAARLLGAAEALRERIGEPLAEPERAAVERTRARARAKLGAAFVRVHAQGRALAPECAIAEAGGFNTAALAAQPA